MRFRSSSLFSAVATAASLVFGLAVPSLSMASLENPERLPPFWVEAEPLHADDILGGPFRLTREMRSGRSLATLKDSLADSPGLLMQESFGGFEPPRLSIRGSGLQSAPSSRGISFLLNGFPLGLADGSFNSALIDPQVADHIEIFRGDTIAAVSPAVLGGVIDFRTRDKTHAVTLDTQAGSFGAVRASLAGAADVACGSWSGTAGFARQDGFREHSSQDRATLFGEVSYPFLTGCGTSVSIYHVRAVYDVPGPLTMAGATLYPRSASADVRRDQPRRESSVTQITSRFQQQNAAIALDGGVSWLRSRDWFRQLQPNGISESKSDDINLHGTLTRRLESGVGDHFLRLTTGISRGWRQVQRWRNDAGITGNEFGRDGLFATTAHADAEDMIRISENLAVAPAVTAVTAWRDISDRVRYEGDPPTTLRMRSSTVLPRGRVTWAATPALNIHTGFIEMVEPPTFDDLLIVTGAYPKLSRRSQILLTQRATTWEIGATGTHGRLAWDVTAYSAAWRNEILRLADDRGQPRGAVNAGPTRHRGIEASLRSRLIDGPQKLSFITTLAWTLFTFDEDPLYGRNRLAGAPPHQGSARFVYEHPSGVFVSPEIEWTAGVTPVDHAGRLGYGGHTLVHLRAGYSKTKAWTLFIEVKNVGDRNYIASTAGVLDLARNPTTTSVFLPGNRRGIILGCEWPFR